MSKSQSISKVNFETGKLSETWTSTRDLRPGGPEE